VTELNLGSPSLRAEIVGRALRVRIDRAHKRNSITQDMYRGIKRACVLVNGDKELDALCLTGSEDVFAVGGDMSGENADPDGLAQEWDPSDHFPFRQLDECRKIVVAAVNGLCQAGGLNMLLFSDVVICSDRARFRIPELSRGVPDPWIAARLASFIGIGRAKFYTFTGTPFDAHEALAMGLVGRVVPHEALDAAVDEALLAISRTAPKCRAEVKAEMHRHLPPVDMNMFRRSLLSKEMIEGMGAFLEKREPNWPRE